MSAQIVSGLQKGCPTRQGGGVRGQPVMRRTDSRRQRSPSGPPMARRAVLAQGPTATMRPRPASVRGVIVVSAGALLIVFCLSLDVELYMRPAMEGKQNVGVTLVIVVSASPSSSVLPPWSSLLPSSAS